MCTFVYKVINSQTMGKKRPDDLGSHFRMHTQKKWGQFKAEAKFGSKDKK